MACSARRWAPSTSGAATDAAGGTTIHDALSGAAVPVSASVNLAAGSVTSVSAIDPLTGAPVAIPYGVNLDGELWISPLGTDITNSGAGRQRRRRSS
ncbi:MAG: hypothetical protein WDM96_09720, partial [Lacunisphaera sp.]